MEKKLEKSSIKSIEEILSPVLFIPETMRADRLMNIFRKEHSEFALVVDEFGGVAGLITLEDLMVEILGYMSDEFKGRKKKYEKLPDGRIRISGSAPVSDITNLTPIEWKGEANTIGGQIIEIIQRIPEEGESLTLDNVKIKIEKMDKNVISSLLITSS